MQRPATWKVATVGAAIAVAATFGASIAQAVADTGGTGDAAHSGSYGSQSVKGEAAKFGQRSPVQTATDPSRGMF